MKKFKDLKINDVVYYVDTYRLEKGVLTQRVKGISANKHDKSRIDIHTYDKIGEYPSLDVNPEEEGMRFSSKILACSITALNIQLTFYLESNVRDAELKLQIAQGCLRTHLDNPLTL